MTVSQIARDAGLHERRVYEHLRTLKAAGILEIDTGRARAAASTEPGRR